MGEQTKIEWADATWNPWMGCHKVSEGCKYCYMYREQSMYGRDPNVVVRSKTRFDAPLKWAKQGKLAAGSRIFVCSWSDFFLSEADPIRGEAWEIIRSLPQYDFLILTKRPERIRECLPKPEDWKFGWKNVWLGVSVESSKHLERINELCKVVAWKKFLSLEPLLEDIDLLRKIEASEDAWDWVNADPDDSEPEEFVEENELMCDWINFGNDLVPNPEYKDWMQGRETEAKWLFFRHEIDWVIVGGESGPEARQMHPDWVRNVRDLCQSSNVPFFFKSWGEWMCSEPDEEYKLADGQPYYIWQRVGRKAAGRKLDGRTWDEFPKRG